MSPFLATLLLAPLIGADRPPVGPEVRGRVVAEGKPLSGARVVAVAVPSPLDAARLEARGGKPPEPLAAATTGPDGAFVLKLASAPAGEVEIQASASGFVPARTETVDGPSLDLSLEKGQALSGRVVDPSGGPVVGASVTLWPGRDASLPLAGTATTDAKGAFHLDAAAATGNRLRVEGPGPDQRGADWPPSGRPACGGDAVAGPHRPGHRVPARRALAGGCGSRALRGDIPQPMDRDARRRHLRAPGARRGPRPHRGRGG